MGKVFNCNAIEHGEREQLSLPSAEPLPASLPYDQYGPPIQSIQVRLMGEFSQTADGACRVEFGDHQTAYVKPRPDAEKNLLVAREKICADLGVALGFCVAPAIVRQPEVPTWPYHTLMSIETLAAPRLWEQGSPELVETFLDRLEELRVFWTWIGDDDHNSHGGNLLYELSDDGGRVLAIDHAYSLCHGNGQDPLQVAQSHGYGSFGRADDAMVASIAKIQSLDFNIVRAIVGRLDPILSQDEQARILNILSVRGNHLSRLLGA